jgi:MFS family permease
MDRSGKIRSSPRDAMIADASSNLNRGHNFGILRSMDNLGAVVGIVIGILLFRFLGYRTLFLLAAIPSIFAALLVFRRITERKASKARAYKGISIRRMSSSLRLYTLLSGIFALGSFSYSFLLIFSREAGVAEGTVPVFYLVFTGVASIFSVVFGRLSDRIGRERVIMLSLAIWAVVCSLMVIQGSIILLIISFVLYGLHKGSLDPVQGSLVSELAPPDIKASTIGGFQMIIGLCAFPSSLVAGLLWDSFGPRAPFFLSIVLTGMSMMLLFPMRHLRTKL